MIAGNDPSSKVGDWSGGGVVGSATFVVGGGVLGFVSSAGGGVDGFAMAVFAESSGDFVVLSAAPTVGGDIDGRRTVWAVESSS